MIRVLIADDSRVAREMLTRLIEEDPEMIVAGTASSGEDTVQKALGLKPDLITMDLLMPDMDGVEATSRIMAAAPTPIVFVSSAVTSAHSQTHFDALAVGAVDVVEKPDFMSFTRDPSLKRKFLENLRSMSQVVTLTRRRPRSEDPREGRTHSTPLLNSEFDAKIGPPGATKVIVVGASTGGPAVVLQTLALLQAETAPPVVLVQHMACGFSDGFIHWLNQNLKIHAELATDRVRLEPGKLYVAPDERHVEISPFGRLGVYQAPPLRFHRPSVDILFQSAAAVMGREAIGVLLTGMGDDGARGLQSMHEAGAFTIAQDRQSSLIYGMPGAAMERGAVSMSANPDSIAEALQRVRVLQSQAKVSTG